VVIPGIGRRVSAELQEKKSDEGGGRGKGRDSIKKRPEVREQLRSVIGARKKKGFKVGEGGMGHKGGEKKLTRRRATHVRQQRKKEG